MTVCRFYQQGTCKFGSRCRFEHPVDDQGFRNQPFGVRQQLNFGGTSSTSSAFGSGNRGNVSFANQQQQPPTVQEILNTISLEMETWEKSKMWPFSCFGYQKGVKSFPGLEDHSMEEVRLKAYEAQQSGNIDQYKQWLAHMVTDFNAKKQELKRPSGATKQKLVSLIDDLNKILAASEKGSGNSSDNVSSMTRTTGLFGKSTLGGTSTLTAAPNQNPFGGGTKTASQSTFNSGQNMFGGSSAGAQSVFGGGASGSQGVFGGNPSQAQSTFGGISGTPQSVFGGASATGQQSTFGASSVFGGSASQTSAPQAVFGAAAVFGGSQTSSAAQQPTVAVSAASSVFAPTSQQTGLFGKPASTTGPFGGGSSSTGIFSQPSQATASNQNPFGASSTVSSSSQAMGSKDQTGQGLFGKAFQGTVSQAPLSGLQTQQAPSTAPIPFQAGSSVAQSTAPGTQTISSLYTPLDQLTAEERAQFEAPKFTPGKIPARPPPREFV